MRTRRSRLLTAFAVTGLLATSAIGASAQDPSPSGAPAGIAITAAPATITVDGDVADWSTIEATTVNLEQIRLDGLDPEQAAEIEFGAVAPIDVSLKVASDADNIYMLVEVPTAFVYTADNHNLSPSLAVQFPIEELASTHMGAEEADLYASTGMVDLWHWELDCAAGASSGGHAVAGGDDPACNLDDEYATYPREARGRRRRRHPERTAENSLNGVWTHTGVATGPGAEGTWIFEMSRPLQTGDPQDAQFASGSVAKVALAWFDPTEGAEGWSDAGHLNSSYNGWIEVTLP